VHVDLELRVDQGGTDTANLLFLQMSPGYRLTLHGAEGPPNSTTLILIETFRLDGGIHYNTVPGNYVVANGTWVRLEIDVTLSGQGSTGWTGSLQASFDGASPPAIAGPLTPQLDSQPGIQLTVGLNDWSGPSAWTAHYDNVLFDVTP
jgi:hypothetical protein